MFVNFVSLLFFFAALGFVNVHVLFSSRENEFEGQTLRKHRCYCDTNDIQRMRQQIE